MGIELPEPADEALERSPLRLVVSQLRFPPAPDAGELRAGLALQEGLGGAEVWRMEQLKRGSFTVDTTSSSMAPPVVEVQSGGWRLTSQDGLWNATLQPDSLGLETTKYTSWREFSSMIGRMLVAVDQSVKPKAELRLGLRYINRIDDPRVEAASGWRQWIPGEVLGILLTQIGAGAVAGQQQVDIVTGGGFDGTIRHGFFRDAATSSMPYVIDIDTHREGTRTFDMNQILVAMNSLNRLARQLFQGMIKPEAYAYFKGMR